MKSSSQDNTVACHKALVNMVVPSNKDYQKALDSIQKVRDGAGDETFYKLVNFQDNSGKTLIHHLIENSNNGYFSELWVVIELHLKGASTDLQDNLGNTALHSCAYMHQGEMKAQVCSPGITTFASHLCLGLIEVDIGKRPGDERVMFSCMAEIGALLLCGVPACLKNLKGETVWDIMNSTALTMDKASAKPNISEASCKKAFLTLFDCEKSSFSYNDIFKRIRYPWAPNVVGWVQSLQIDDSVKNASLVATTPASDGCTLF